MKTSFIAVAFGLAAAGAGSAFGAVITQWSFTAVASPPVTSPAPSTGSGTATSLGMNNSYTYSGGELGPSVDSSDIVSTKGTAKKTFVEDTWRIRGNSNVAGPGANGWNNSADNYTQGAEFQVSTAGMAGIGLSFDWYCTTSGVANMQVRYSSDGGATWSNAGADYIASSNDYYNASSPTTPEISIDLSGIAALADNSNFAVEMVSVKPVLGDANYSVTNGDGAYASADNTGDYNNNSGNWRFDNVTITGTPLSPVPEPASLALLGIGVAGMLKGRRRAR